MRSIFDLRRMCPISPGPQQPPVSLHSGVCGCRHLGELQHCPHCRVLGQPRLEMLYPDPICHGPGTPSVGGARPRGAGAPSSQERGEGRVAAASLNQLHSSEASLEGYREGLILSSKHLVGDQTMQRLPA